MLCYFIEVAFINISEVFIKKTTGAEKRLVRLGGEMADGISTVAATNDMFIPLEELALDNRKWGWGDDRFAGALAAHIPLLLSSGNRVESWGHSIELQQVPPGSFSQSCLQCP